MKKYSNGRYGLFRASRTKRISAVFALAFAIAIVAALPMLASATAVDDVDDLGDANDIALSAQENARGDNQGDQNGNLQSQDGNLQGQQGQDNGQDNGTDSDQQGQNGQNGQNGGQQGNQHDGQQGLQVQQGEPDARDIANNQFHTVGKYVVSSTGEAVEPVFEAGGRYGKLVQGQSFRITGYLNSNMESLGDGVKPTTAGVYYAVLEGIDPYHGTNNAQFTVYASNDLSLAVVSCKSKDTQSETYAWTGNPVVPDITVNFNGDVLTQGTHYKISGYKKEQGGGPNVGPATQSDPPTDMGSYYVVIEAVGDEYTGTAQAHFNIADSKSLAKASIEIVSDKQPPTYRYTGEAIVPEVVVTSLDGNILEKGVDYNLQYNKGGSGGPTNNALDEVSEEGQYTVAAVAGPSGAYSGKTEKNPGFYIAKEEHDITRAEIAGVEDEYEFTGNSLEDTIKQSISVTLDGALLTEGTDYELHIDNGNFSGARGTHTVWIKGKNPMLGETSCTYFVKSVEAPAADSRQTAGVTVTGEVIKQRSTYEGEAWVKLLAESQASNDIKEQAETNDELSETAAAIDEAETAGSESVQVFDVKLDRVSTSGNGNERGPEVTEHLTEDFGTINASFPVDTKYNGMNATVTQFHNGTQVASNKNIEVKNGLVTVSADCLSLFVVSVDPIPHTHVWSYSANGATITAKCTAAGCDLTSDPTLTIVKPTLTTVGGEGSAEATITGEIPDVENPPIVYKSGTKTLATAPTTAGTYTANITLGEATASVEYTIANANMSVSASGWTGPYDGEAHGITVKVTDPTSGYTVKYGTSADACTLDASPTITNVADSPLTVYYKVTAEGYEDATGSATVTISKAAIDPKVTIEGWKVGEKANEPKLAEGSNPGNGEVTYAYAKKGSSEWSADAPTTAGDYTVKATVAETANYLGGEATADFTVTGADSKSTTSKTSTSAKTGDNTISVVICLAVVAVVSAAVAFGVARRRRASADKGKDMQ